MSEKFTPEDIHSMLPDAKANEERQRKLTQGDASEDTQKIFEDQEAKQAIEDADPDKPPLWETEEDNQTAQQRERARLAIEKIRKDILAKDKFPDYDNPPKTED